MIRAAIAAVIVVVALGCSFGPVPTSPIVWGDRVPTAAPDAVAAQPIVTRGPDTITLLPISPNGAVLGLGYAYDMPHCGIHSPIDVDGSFWDAVGVPPDSVDFDGSVGTFHLASHTEATFTSLDGKVLLLVRHSGAKEFPFCA